MEITYIMYITFSLVFLFIINLCYIFCKYTNSEDINNIVNHVPFKDQNEL
jgi:hypothetical protein